MKRFLKFQRMISLLLIVAIVVTQTPSQVLAQSQKRELREEDAWASYVERLWIEASRHRFIRKELGLEEI